MGVSLLVYLALAGFAAVGAQPSVPALWAGLAPGTFPAGFTTSLVHDPSRQLDGRSRPVQVTCWFPSARNAGPRLTFRDYVALSASERRPATAAARQAAVDDEKKFFGSVGVDGPVVERWLDQPVYATRGAPPARGTFPLVLVAQGNGQGADQQAILAEYVASHGFVVCTTPSQARLGDEMHSDADVLPSAIAQAADLAIAERYARSHFTVTRAAAALVGHSFGARSALLYAARHGAAALVSLDGGIGAAEARAWVDGAGIDRGRLTTPILHIYEEGDPAITPDLDFLNSLVRADRTLVKLDAMRHIDFTSLGFGAAAVEGLTGPPSRAIAAKVRTVAEYGLRFIRTPGTALPAPRAQEPWLHVWHQAVR